MSLQQSLPKKVLGDAGEHYALSQFSFSGYSAAKMPDLWEGYDLAVETGKKLLRVSVKTRSESLAWRKNRWFNFDDRKECDWIVFLFKPNSGPVRAWIIPFSLAKRHANQPGPMNKQKWYRDLSWTKLTTAPLSAYENNWELQDTPHT